MAADSGRRGSLETVRRPRAGTVRFRLTVLATLLVALVLVVTGVGLVVAQRRLLTSSVDEALRDRAEDIETTVLPALSPSRPVELANLGSEDTLAQVIGPSSQGVVAASPNVTDEPALVRPSARTAGGESIRTVDGLPIDEDAFRLLVQPVRMSADELPPGLPAGTYTVVVAGSVDDVDEATAALARSLALAVPSVTVVLALLLWWLTGRTLRPVESIRATVAGIGGDELDRRVPEPPRDDEIARLARTMNAMLDRIEDASRRQQRFVADAAHELRSPLTRMRSELEVDLAHPDRADHAATHRSVLADADELQQLVDDLLYLARSDAGAATPRRAAVDLDDVVLREGRRLRERGRVEVDTRGVSAAQVTGDAAQLTRMVRNLADNAERHATSTVTFGLHERDGAARLTVSDDGPGIPAADRERIFDRFTRLDSARTRDGGGAGLGLAIVHDIVDHHGGTVTVENTGTPSSRGGGATFAVHLPTNGAGADPTRD
jgi:signal transduction histidine kinase